MTKDLEEKSKIYAAAGIQEYWVVNLRDRALIVFRFPEGDFYQQRNTFRSGTIEPLAFGDLTIHISELMNR